MKVFPVTLARRSSLTAQTPSIMGNSRRFYRTTWSERLISLDSGREGWDRRMFRLLLTGIRITIPRSRRTSIIPTFQRQLYRTDLLHVAKVFHVSA